MTVSRSVEFEPTGFQKQFLTFVLGEKSENLALNNLCTAHRLRGELDVDRLGSVFCEIVKRHESLRTLVVLADDGASPIYRVLDDYAADVDVIDHVSEGGGEEPEALASKIGWRSFRYGEIPVRLYVIRISGQESLVGLTTSHLTTDVISHGIIWSELSSAYGAAGFLQSNPPLAQYRDFVKERTDWEKNWRTSPEAAYWQESLEKGYARNYDYSGAVGPGLLSQSVPEAILDGAVLQQLGQIARRGRSTNYVALLALFTACLTEYSNEALITFAILTDERGTPKFRSVVGNFPLLRPFQIDIGGNPTFAELMARVRTRWLEIFNYPWQPDEVYEKFTRQNPPPVWYDVFDYMKVGAVGLDTGPAKNETNSLQLFGNPAEAVRLEPPVSEYRRPTAFMFTEAESRLSFRVLSANPAAFPSLQCLLTRMRSLIPLLAESDTVTLGSLRANPA